MIRNGMIKSVLLLALGIITIALIGPAAGDTICKCPDNQTCMMMQSSMGDCQDNRTMMCYMMSDMANESCCMLMDQNASTSQARLNCTYFWLEKAIQLHQLHMEDPSTATNESQMELMDYMIHAHECIKGENVTMEMVDNKTTYNDSEDFVCEAHARLKCADFWLEQAIKLHEMHLKDPSTATDESQMEMMEQIMQAHICVLGKDASMDVTDKVRMDCAKIWLKKAMDMHELHMNEYGMEANESEMKMMEQMMDHMMHAYECMAGENMTKGMMNNTMMVQFSGEYEHGC